MVDPSLDLSWLVTLLGVLAVVGGSVGIRALGQRLRSGATLPGAVPLPYLKKDYLLTAAERAFYGVLVQAVDGTWLIFAKVRLADLVWIPAGMVDRQAAWNRIQSKHVDFVLCTPATLTPLLVIELDDASHSRADRAARDNQLGAILGAAGVPLLHMLVRAGYRSAELRAAITEALERTPGAPAHGATDGQELRGSAGKARR